jgi:hypothetical protein
MNNVTVPSFFLMLLLEYKLAVDSKRGRSEEGVAGYSLLGFPSALLFFTSFCTGYLVLSRKELGIPLSH